MAKDSYGGLLTVAKAATTAALPASTYTSTTNPHTLIATANGALAAQDGQTMAVNDILFVKDEATGLRGGLYKVTDAGSAGTTWKLARTRSPRPGQQVVVLAGTLQGGSSWRCTNTAPITVGTTTVTYVPVGAWQSLLNANGSLAAAAAAGTYFLNVAGAVIVTTATALTAAAAIVQLDPANYGGAEQLRVVGQVLNGSVAQTGVSYFFGLYPISSLSAANPPVATLGSVLGETAAIAAPAVQSVNTVYGAAVLLPTTATSYLLCMRQTGTGAASSLPQFRALIQVRG